jgi:uncharacterized protein DUF1275
VTETVRQDIAATLWPRRDSPDGPLPPLLLALTLVTGLVDATSYLTLGRVFVANMTGNVVFLGFGIAGAGGISVWAPLTALGSFLVGGVGGGRIGARWSNDRGANSPPRRRRSFCSSPLGSRPRPSRHITSKPEAATS